ncbi:hypothetical protein F2P56_015189 [Juglans regia]|uniref:Uncharacterized protein LOC108998924 n=2 Tax=Juglans regia TaxID=51240 RepID=A0A2I4FHW2_JUGRE|nr:uncharacterized protein LOC108998924 [Juglans regia]KAF5465160.1 hypothetical protein F2P56_015189 [Juglans regia]
MGEAFKSTMQTVWKAKGRIQFKEVGSNLFVIEFQHAVDLQKVMNGRPWTFDCNLLCLTTFDGHVAPKEITFSTESMWIQLHNIPLGAMTQDIGRLIGSNIGLVEDVDTDDDGIG